MYLIYGIQKSGLSIVNYFENNKINYDIFVNELKIQTAWQQLIFQLFKNKVQIDENEIIKLANEFKDTRQFKEFDLSEIVITFENNNEIA